MTKNKQSEFNSSLDVLTRVNGLFHIANTHAYQQEYTLWCKTLLIIYREIEKFIPQKEAQEIDSKLWSEHYKLTNTANNKFVSEQTLKNLHFLDKELRGYFHSSGLGIKTKEQHDEWDW